ncbi:hypothetical protein B0J11DRAFT_601000 [Dendryphion nanum]|uniref:Uncharacterized protein n=1 Tax=Dendryphion nanum TaxID=256645 RepID=A0A9P9E7E3_9PLEO|nr:hypothetical protein B0J11DRAFT_601000 [Dendryphion nanum]
MAGHLTLGRGKKRWTDGGLLFDDGDGGEEEDDDDNAEADGYNALRSIPLHPLCARVPQRRQEITMGRLERRHCSRERERERDNIWSQRVQGATTRAETVVTGGRWMELVSRWWGGWPVQGKSPARLAGRGQWPALRPELLFQRLFMPSLPGWGQWQARKQVYSGVAARGWPQFAPALATHPCPALAGWAVSLDGPCLQARRAPRTLVVPSPAASPAGLGASLGSDWLVGTAHICSHACSWGGMDDANLACGPETGRMRAQRTTRLRKATMALDSLTRSSPLRQSSHLSRIVSLTTRLLRAHTDNRHYSGLWIASLTATALLLLLFNCHNG